MAKKTKKITIPHEWEPRAYQWPLWCYLVNGGRRAAVVWHRRAGKDSLALNWTCVAAHMKVGVYWHMLPTLKQGRKVVWENITGGKRVIDHVFPEELRESTNDTEMRIKLKCGSIWQVVGSDNYDSLVGANPAGVVLSEYSVADPAAWRFLSPILAENQGWAVFIYTPRGKNHGYKLFQMAQKNEKWYSELLTLESSNAYPLDIVEEERESGMPEEMVQQEYFCSFDSGVIGAYYAKLLSKLDKSGRYGTFPYDPKFPVCTGWDFGIDDDTVIWFIQLIGPSEIRVIDYYSNRGLGMDEYVKVLTEKPYTYSDHYFPHDGKARGKWVARSGKDIFESLMNQYATIVSRELKLADEVGVQAVRSILPRCTFNRETTEVGFDAMTMYRSAFDEKTQTYRPVHDWTSHSADGFKTFALGFQERRPEQKRQTVAQIDYNPVDYNENHMNRQQVVEDYDPFKY